VNFIFTVLVDDVFIYLSDMHTLRTGQWINENIYFHNQNICPIGKFTLRCYILAVSTRFLLHESRTVGSLNLTSPTCINFKPNVTIKSTASDNWRLWLKWRRISQHYECDIYSQHDMTHTTQPLIWNRSNMFIHTAIMTCSFAYFTNKAQQHAINIINKITYVW
jgi:type IV secretory pathway TraG/TraD family ATPase VirD4